MARGGKSGDQVSDAVKDSGHCGYFPWAYAVLPKASDHRAEPKKNNRQGEVQRNISKLPMLGANERLDEHAPPVHGSQADLHDHCCYCNAPPVGKLISRHGHLI